MPSTAGASLAVEVWWLIGHSGQPYYFVYRCKYISKSNLAVYIHVIH